MSNQGSRSSWNLATLLMPNGRTRRHNSKALVTDVVTSSWQNLQDGTARRLLKLLLTKHLFATAKPWPVLYNRAPSLDQIAISRSWPSWYSPWPLSSGFRLVNLIVCNERKLFHAPQVETWKSMFIRAQINDSRDGRQGTLKRSRVPSFK